LFLLLMAKAMFAFPVQRNPAKPVAENRNYFFGLSGEPPAGTPFSVEASREFADGPGDRFEATRWSVVLMAGRELAAPELARDALAQLCGTYWAPLYGFIRGRGYSVHDAQDLTQGFFCHLIEQRIYARTDQTKGKFRSFLLASVKHFLNDAYGRARALKRGGNYEFLPLHDEQAQAAEASFCRSTAPGLDTAEDRLFERQWAQTLIDTTLGKLTAGYEAEGKGTLFRSLEVFVRGGAAPLPSYEQVSGQLAMPAATVRSHVGRLRARYRELLRAELRRTVETEEEVDQELRELLRVLTAR
jgi:DNA-directed RNA polymerase specialized sigma24 family protein